MSCGPFLPPLHATAEPSPSLDPAKRFPALERMQHDGSPPPRSMSVTLPTSENSGHRDALLTLSPTHSPVMSTLSPMRHRAATRPPEPVDAAATAEEAPLSPSPSIEGGADRQRLVALIDRFMQLLSPSTERLVRLSGALRGLRDSVGPTQLATPSPAASPLASPGPQHELPVENPVGPPRLCVTGVSDVDMDEVFQFLLHRDCAGLGGRSGLNSASSAVRPPTPDGAWAGSAHASSAVGSQRRSRPDTLGAASPPNVSSSEETTPPLPPALLPSFSATTQVSLSGLLSSSNVTLSEEGPDTVTTVPLNGFPTTPPPPPTGFGSRALAEMGSRGTVVTIPRLTDSPSPDHFALPTLHNRSESSIRRAVPRDLPGEPPLETRPAPALHPQQTPTMYTSYTGPITAATTAVSGVALVGSAAGPAVKVPAAPSGATHTRSVSPHAPLLMNGVHTDSGPSVTGAAALHNSPSPPLPAAPANHNLRTVHPVPSLESRMLSSVTPPVSLPKNERGVADVERSDVALVPPSRHDVRTEVTFMEEAEEEATVAGVDGETHAADLSTTMPDLGDNPTVPALQPQPTATAAVVHCASPSPRNTSGMAPRTQTTIKSPPHRRTTCALQHENRSEATATGGVGITGAPTPVTPSPTSLGESSNTTAPTQQQLSGSTVFRRRTAQLPLAVSPEIASADGSPTTPTPIVAVLLHRTASQHSESSEHQRPFLTNSPSPGAGRFTTLPAPFFSRVSGAASSMGRSLRDDSTLLSPGSSFSPAAARLVQRLRRRTITLAPAQLRFTAWDLYHLDRLTGRDWALLQAMRPSYPTLGQTERVGRSSKGGPAPKRGSGDASGGTGVHHSKRRSSPQLVFNSASGSSTVTGATPWMVGISEDGVVRYEAPPAAHATTTLTQAPPITTNSDFSFLCIPFEVMSALSTEDCASVMDVNDAESTTATVATDNLVGVVGDTEEVTRALNLLFGVFAGWRQQPRSAAPVGSILVTPEGVSSPGAAAAAAAANGVSGDATADAVASLSSPPLSVLASPHHKTAGRFGFPALGRAGSNSEAGLRGTVRSWRRTPPPLFEKSTGSEHFRGAGGAAAGREGRSARVQGSESPRHGLSSGAAHGSAPFLSAAAERRGGSGQSEVSDGVGDLHDSLHFDSLHEAAMEDWLRPLRQALANRTVFVLVRSEQTTIAAPPPPAPRAPPPPPPAHSPRRASTAEAGGGAGQVPAMPPVTNSTVVENFVRLVKSRYGVTVPSWRVIVFSYHDSVVTRNLLLSYYAHKSGRGLQQHQQQSKSGSSRDETLYGEVVESCEYTTEDLSPALPVGGTHSTAPAETGNGSTPMPSVPLPVTPPLLEKGSGAGHTPSRSAVSPLMKPMIPAAPSSALAASLSSQRGGRPGSRSQLLLSASRINLKSSLQSSAEEGSMRSHPLSPAQGSASAAPATATATALDAALGEEATRYATMLFSALTKEVGVPPLAAALATYTALASQVGCPVQASPSQPTPMKPTSKTASHRKVPTTSSVEDAQRRTTMQPFSSTTSEAAASGHDDDEPRASADQRASLGRALSLSNASETTAMTVTRKENDFSTAVCRHALQVMWRASGAATLNSAFRLFEHEAAVHRTSQSAFSIMAWAWQLRATLPAVVKAGEQRCSHLRNSQHRMKNRLEALEKSIGMHASSSPARNVTAMEARLQSSFAVMTQRFAHDVRRLLISPSPTLNTSARPAPSLSGSSASLGSAAATSPQRRLQHQHQHQQQSMNIKVPSMDALRAYETPGLREAYRRLVYHVLQFRDFYIHGQLSAELSGEDSGKITDVNSEETTGPRWNASLYESHFLALREQLTAPEPPQSTVGNGAYQDREISPIANASSSTRAASVSATPPPPPLSSSGVQSRVSQSLPPPPHLNDLAEAEAEEQMPRVDRSIPRERRVSLIASVASSASAPGLNSSSEMLSRTSLAATVVAMPPAAAAAAAANARDDAHVVAGEDTNSLPGKKNSPSSGSAALPLPRKSREAHRIELQQRRLMMEHQLIAHVSQLNTEIINFFLATCVAALPYMERSCVQAEIERVRTAHAEMYSTYTTAVHGRKDAAMHMASLYGNLEQWTTEVGPLLSMVHSRRYLEKFVSQLRAVLCEDQIRALAAHRDCRDGKGTGKTAQLTTANLARHRTAIAASNSTVKAKKTLDVRQTRKSQRLPSAAITKAKTAAMTTVNGGASSDASTELGVRSARLLLYYTRLACKPELPKPTTNESSTKRTGLGENAAFAASSTRPARPSSGASTATSHRSISRRRRGGGGGGLGDTISLTSMSAAWNREEEVHRSAGRAVSGGGNAHAGPPSPQRPDKARVMELEGEMFFATPHQPNMLAVSSLLLTALGGSPNDGDNAPLPTTSAVVRTPTRHVHRHENSADALDASLLTPSNSPSTLTTSHSSRAAGGRRGTRSTNRSTTGNGDAAGQPESSVAWRTRLAKWRARLSEAERPADISAAPVLWMLLDTWDETLLRFPYGLLLNFHATRYAESLNALSEPIVESQLKFKSRLTEATASALKEQEALEKEMKRLQGLDGGVNADFVAALKAIFDDAEALASADDEAVHASFFE